MVAVAHVCEHERMLQACANVHACVRVRARVRVRLKPEGNLWKLCLEACLVKPTGNGSISRHAWLSIRNS